MPLIIYTLGWTNTCMYAHAITRTHRCAHTDTHTHTQIHTHARIHTNIQAYPWFNELHYIKDTEGFIKNPRYYIIYYVILCLKTYYSPILSQVNDGFDKHKE